MSWNSNDASAISGIVSAVVATIGIVSFAAACYRYRTSRLLARTHDMEYAHEQAEGVRGDFVTFFCSLITPLTFDESKTPLVSVLPLSELATPRHYVSLAPSVPWSIARLREGLTMPNRENNQVEKARDVIYTIAARHFLTYLESVLQRVRDGLFSREPMHDYVSTWFSNAIIATTDENGLPLIVSFSFFYEYIDILKFAASKGLITEAVVKEAVSWQLAKLTLTPDDLKIWNRI